MFTLFLRYIGTCFEISLSGYIYTFLRYIVCEASFFTFRIAFCIMFVAITSILSTDMYGIFLYGLSDGQKINMPRNIRRVVPKIECLPRRQSRSFINTYVCVQLFIRYRTGTV